jgi:hypothetical protein
MAAAKRRTFDVFVACWVLRRTAPHTPQEALAATRDKMALVESRAKTLQSDLSAARTVFFLLFFLSCACFSEHLSLSLVASLSISLSPYLGPPLLGCGCLNPKP